MDDQLPLGLANQQSTDQTRAAQLQRTIAWQVRLHDHFTTLSAERAASGWPVFALEHGLNEGERTALANDVRQMIRWGTPSAKTPLPWIVYAAEIGYEYDGDEYWPVFAARTPGWQESWRELLRYRFISFAEAYRGARPAGRWADWFKNIAWPITHGVLPQDLQGQLAELLYYARTTFRHDTFASSEVLGSHLQGQSDHSSSRFQRFAENTALLGQIAFALLLQDTGSQGLPSSLSQVADPQSTPASHLLPSTLARIVEDLQRERDAGERLSEAQKVAHRVRLRGLTRLTPSDRDGRDLFSKGQVATKNAGTPIRPELASPRLLLRALTATRWEVRLQFPNLRDFATRVPTIRDILSRAQGRVAAAGNYVLASGRIVGPEQWPDIPLRSWPASGSPLLTFDHAPPELRVALDASFRAPQGDKWLFVIESDGQAREQASRTLRSGESYVLIRLIGTGNPPAELVPIDLTCTGAFALRIDIPEVPSDRLLAILETLGLGISSSLEVWPAALPIADWARDGRAEWLTDDLAMLGVRANHRISTLSVAIDGHGFQSAPLTSASKKGNTVFLAIPQLSEGRHRVAIRAETTSIPSDPTSTASVGRSIEGALDVLVRSPRVTTALANGALWLTSQPRAPSLEDVWDGRFELHAIAPGVKTLRCRICLLAKGNAVPLATYNLNALPVPLDTASWRTAFSRQVLDAQEQHYDEANSCTIDFDAGVLGRARIVAEREFTPLRWIVREEGRTARLIDSGVALPLAVSMYDCESPDIAKLVDPLEASNGIALAASGALLVARSGDQESALVAVPNQRIQSFAALGGQPFVAACAREPTALARLIHVIATWERARLAANPLAAHRRHNAVEATTDCMIRAIAGGQWAVADATSRSAIANVELAAPATKLIADRTLAHAKSLVTSHRDERGICTAITLRIDDYCLEGAEGRETSFVEQVCSFSRAKDVVGASRFALRLATSPTACVGWARVEGVKGEAGKPYFGRSGSASLTDSEGLGRAIDALLTSPTIFRAARFLALSVSAHGGSPWLWV